MEDKQANYEPVDSAVWGTRLEALRKAMADFRIVLSAPERRNPDMLMVFQQTVDALNNYLTYVFQDYFLAGFINGTLPEDKKYPYQYVLERTLAQASSDLAILGQLWGQAVAEYLSQPDKTAAGEQVDLKGVQLIAAKALEPARAAGLLEEAIVLPYYRKAPNIRTIPYAPIAFMGVPYTSILAKQDLLAIPHETGHHVYWRGKVNGQPIWLYLDRVLRGRLDLKKKEERSSYLLAEEIFADVYGCLVAGPTIALSAQDLQLAATDDEFELGDTEHPAPKIRPRIYTRILGKMGHQEWARALDLKWGSSLARREDRLSAHKRALLEDMDPRQQSLPSIEERSAGVGTPPVELAPDLPQPIQTVVDICFDLLQGIGEERVAPWASNTTIPAAGSTDPETLFPQFSGALTLFLEQERKNLTQYPGTILLPPPVELVAGWEELVEADTETDPETPIWRYVFENGWADKGPHGRH